MAEFRCLSAWEIAELTKRTRKNKNGASEDPVEKHPELAEYLNKTIKPYADNAPFPISVFDAAKLLALSNTSECFSKN